MSRNAQRVQPVDAATARDAGTPARRGALASRIGNRAMARIALGEIPAGLSSTARPLQRDTPKDGQPDPHTPKDGQPDPRSGLWAKFQGSRSSGWVPLGNYSLTGTKDDGLDAAFIDVLADSPKGLHLGEALDNEEHITVVIEARQPHGSPRRQTIRDAVITSVSVTDEINPTKPDPTGTYDLTTRRHVVRVGLRLPDKASAKH